MKAKPTATIFELKPPFGKKGLGGGTLAAQPISQTILELELEGRSGEGVTRAVLTDSFTLRLILNLRKDGLSKHYVSKRIFEPVEYIIHLLFSFVPQSNEELFLGFVEYTDEDEDGDGDGDGDDCDVAEKFENMKLGEGAGPSSRTRSKIGNQGRRASENDDMNFGVGGGGAALVSSTRRSKVSKNSHDERSTNNENAFCPDPSRITINLNFQDKVDANNETLEWLKAGDARRNGLVLLTESELRRTGQRRAIDQWMSYRYC
jgi:hypothetical protein